MFNYISPYLVAGTIVFAVGFYLIYRVAEIYDKNDSPND